MNRFLIFFSIITLILVIGALILVENFAPEMPRNFIYYPVILIGSITLISHYILHRTLQKAPKKFVRHFLLLTTLRLLTYLIFILLFVSTHRNFAKPFLLHFLLVYLFYQVLEVTELSSKSNS